MKIPEIDLNVRDAGNILMDQETAEACEHLAYLVGRAECEGVIDLTRLAFTEDDVRLATRVFQWFCTHHFYEAAIAELEAQKGKDDER